MSDTLQWPILIDGEKSNVYMRDEQHNLGSLNASSNHYWLNHRDSWVPYLDKFVHRVCWKFEIEQRNYTKEKWGGTHLNKSIFTKMYANNVLVYEFACRDLEYAHAKITVLKTEMEEHPFDFFDIEENYGRKVWFYGQPGIIRPSYYDAGRISILKDGEGGFNLKKPWDVEEWVSEWNGSAEVHTDVFSPDIYWYRD